MKRQTSPNNVQHMHAGCHLEMACSFFCGFGRIFSNQLFAAIITIQIALQLFGISSAIASTDAWEKHCEENPSGYRGCYLVQSLIVKGSNRIGGSIIIWHDPIVFSDRKEKGLSEKTKSAILMRVAVPFGVLRDKRVVLMTPDDRLGSYNFTDCTQSEGCYVDFWPTDDLLQKIMQAKRSSGHLPRGFQNCTSLTF